MDRAVDRCDCSRLTPLTRLPKPREVRTFAVYRAYIEHEDTLIDQRMTWFIQLHSFLIATYSVLTGAVASVLLGSAKVASVMLPLVLTIGTAMQFAVALVGIVSAASAFVSVRAAMRAVDKLSKMGNLLLADAQSRDALPLLSGGGQRLERPGAMLATALPFMLILSWIASMSIPFSIWKRIPSPVDAAQAATPSISTKSAPSAT